MLALTVKAFSVFDEATEQFISVDKPTSLLLENSLYAIGEWEKKYKKPWFPDSRASAYAKKKEQQEKTPEEILYFIKCMIRYKDRELIIDVSEIDEKLLYGLTEEDLKKVTDYLQDSQTALSSIPETKPDKKHKSDPIRLTSDRMYAWLAELQIPFEAEYWNINRLMNVIQVVNYDNTPDDRKKRAKPMEVAQDYARINEERLKKLGTKG